MKNQKCEVCKETINKYKCPKCRILYCSVGCFKTHKEDCSPVPVVETLQAGVSTEKKEVEEFELDEEETEDKVPLEKLELLEESEELKSILGNPHLRQMLTALVEDKDPADRLEISMQEPIFTEFADKCLSIVAENNT